MPNSAGKLPMISGKKRGAHSLCTLREALVGLRENAEEAPQVGRNLRHHFSRKKITSFLLETSVENHVKK